MLILDGLEPLQYTQNLQPMNGELQDSALKDLIAGRSVEYRGSVRDLIREVQIA